MAECKKNKFKIDLGSITIIFIVLIVVVVLSLTTDTFLTYSNIYSIIFGMSMQFFAIIGLTYLIIMGETDLSVGSIYGFGGSFIALLIMTYKLPFLYAILITVAIASLIGLINGQLIARYKVNSMIITIGTMFALRGVHLLIVKKIGSASFSLSSRSIVSINYNGIHLTVIVMIILVAILELLLHKSTLFKRIFIIGNNIETAKIYGIKSNKIITIAYIVSAFGAAFGGILTSLRLGWVSDSLGDGLEFTLITAIIIGGASLSGGKGSILNAVFGLLFLNIIQNGMIMYDINPYYQQIVIGVMLIGAVLADRIANRGNA